MHHLERPGRDELHIGAHLVDIGQVRVGEGFLVFFHSVADLVIGDVDLAAPVGPAMRDEAGLIGPKLHRRADMRMAINDHGFLPLD